MNYDRAIRILALASATAQNPAPEYSLRRIFRWYSEKFHTPLHVIDDLPLHDVLTHYYEWHVEQILDDEDALNKEISELTATPEEIRAQKMLRDRETYNDFSFEKEVRTEAAKQQVEAKKEALIEAQKPPKPVVFSAPDPSRQAIQINEPPDIKVSFASLEEFEELENSDGIGFTGFEKKK